MRGPEGAPAFAQSSRELKGLQRELRDAHALWCVLVLGFAGTGLALLSSLQCVAGLPVLLTFAFVWAGFAWSPRGARGALRDPEAARGGGRRPVADAPGAGSPGRA